MQKHHIACLAIALHVTSLLAVKYLNIDVSLANNTLDEIFSLITQKGIFSAAIFPLIIYYLYRGASIAWWLTTIYTSIYILLALPGLALATLFYYEGTNSLTTAILLVVQVTLLTYGIICLLSKPVRTYCNKSYRESLSVQ